MRALPHPPHTILVVDDHDSVRHALGRLLRIEGYGVIQAANGAEALDLLRGRRKPNLILLDLMMPVMDGWEFRRHQLADPALAEIPVVILTAAGDPSLAALRAEGLTCFTKPPDTEELLALVRTHCE